MGASPIVRRVYREHIDRLGEPDRSIVYEDHDERPSRIEIFVWHASPERDVTIFSTIGMAAAPMSGASHRAELHFVIRRERQLDPATVGETSTFLANLAIYPFVNKTFFDWFHKVRGPVPLFPGAAGVLFHPRFVETGWDTIEFDGVPVKILNVVPISQDEYQMDLWDLFDHWTKTNADLFTPRMMTTDSWDDFTADLGRDLAGMAHDTWIFNHGARYVQVAAGPRVTSLETVSNVYLPPDQALTPDEEQTLRRLGWGEPQPPDWTNWRLEYPWPLSPSQAAEAARALTDAIRAILRPPRPTDLEIDIFSR